MTNKIVFFLLLFWALATANAEQVIMRAGQIYTGKIVNQTRTTVTIDTAQGRIVLNKGDIRRINYGPTAEEKTREEENKKAEQAAAREQAEEDARQKEEEKKQERIAREAAAREEKERTDRLKKAEEDRRAAEAKKNSEEDAKKAEDRRLSEEEMRARLRQEVREALKDEEARKQKELDDAKRREELLRSTPTIGGALVRSLILPGWGQYYQGRHATGLIYATSAIALGQATAHRDSVYDHRQQTYNSTARTFLLFTPFYSRMLGLTFDDTTTQYIFLFGSNTNAGNYAALDKAARYAKAVRGAFIGFYVWNLMDVVVFSPRTSISLGATGDGMRFAYNFRY